MAVPDDWDDASLITLLAPPVPSARTLAARAPAEERPNLVLRRQPFEAERLDLEAFARAQEEMMRALMEDVSIVARGALEIGAPPLRATSRELTFRTPTGFVRQLQIYFVAGGALYTLCGTGPVDGARFEALRGRFLEIAKTLRFE